MKESDIVRAILDRLALDPDLEVLRINAGSIRTGSRWVKLAPAGVSDLLLCVAVRLTRERLSGDGTHTVATAPRLGRFCALEVKRPGQKPTDKQQAWLDRVAELGGHSAVVHSADEAVAEVEAARAV